MDSADEEEENYAQKTQEAEEEEGLPPSDEEHKEKRAERTKEERIEEEKRGSDLGDINDLIEDEILDIDSPTQTHKPSLMDQDNTNPPIEDQTAAAIRPPAGDTAAEEEEKEEAAPSRRRLRGASKVTTAAAVSDKNKARDKLQIAPQASDGAPPGSMTTSGVFGFGSEIPRGATEAQIHAMEIAGAIAADLANETEPTPGGGSSPLAGGLGPMLSPARLLGVRSRLSKEGGKDDDIQKKKKEEEGPGAGTSSPAGRAEVSGKAGDDAPTGRGKEEESEEEEEEDEPTPTPSQLSLDKGLAGRTLVDDEVEGGRAVSDPGRGAQRGRKGATHPRRDKERIEEEDDGMDGAPLAATEAQFGTTEAIPMEEESAEEIDLAQEESSKEEESAHEDQDMDLGFDAGGGSDLDLDLEDTEEEESETESEGAPAVPAVPKTVPQPSPKIPSPEVVVAPPSAEEERRKGSVEEALPRGRNRKQRGPSRAPFSQPAFLEESQPAPAPVAAAGGRNSRRWRSKAEEIPAPATAPAKAKAETSKAAAAKAKQPSTAAGKRKAAATKVKTKASAPPPPKQNGAQAAAKRSQTTAKKPAENTEEEVLKDEAKTPAAAAAASTAAAEAVSKPRGGASAGGTAARTTRSTAEKRKAIELEEKEEPLVENSRGEEGEGGNSKSRGGAKKAKVEVPKKAKVEPKKAAKKPAPSLVEEPHAAVAPSAAAPAAAAPAAPAAAPQERGGGRRSAHIALSGMHTPQQRELCEKLSKVKDVEVTSGVDSHDWQPDFTHVIAPAVLRNQKCLAALAAGAWLVSPAFASACSKAKKLVDEEPYEIAAPGAGGLVESSVARFWRLRRDSTGHGAFSGLSFALARQLDDPPSREDLCGIIKAGDGLLVPLSRQADVVIAAASIAQSNASVQRQVKGGALCVSSGWLVDWLARPGMSLDCHLLLEGENRRGPALARAEAERGGTHRAEAESSISL